MAKRAMALGAHPDDIEFMMGGTFLLLGEAGFELHYMNLLNGCCGSVTRTREETAAMRLEEGRAAAGLAGAVFHEPLLNDLESFYEKDPLAKLAKVLREVNPSILLLPSPEDYMEDHMNTSRLGVSAAFVMGMKNFPTDPPSEPAAPDCILYHALPYGLHDGMRRRIWPGQYADVTGVLARKRGMLACHASQKEWLDKTQGLDAYLETMEAMSREVGTMSGRFEAAEGWRRHSHLGYSAEEKDPLAEALGERLWTDPAYDAWLEAKPF